MITWYEQKTNKCSKNNKNSFTENKWLCYNLRIAGHLERGADNYGKQQV